jgi:hypothetical protein
MKGHLYRYVDDCDEQNLAQIIQQQPEDVWIYLEHDYPLHGDYAVYLKFLENAVEPERYAIGRIFNENFEIRWQRLPYSGISIQLLCEDEKYLQDKFTLVEEFDTNADRIFLWGTHTKHLKNKHDFMVQDDVWIETRIPRPLEYPLRDGSMPAHVQIKTRGYHQLDTGILRTTRWLALEKSEREKSK